MVTDFITLVISHAAQTRFCVRLSIITHADGSRVRDHLRLRTIAKSQNHRGG